MNRKMNTNAREKRTLMKMVPPRYELKEELLNKVNGGVAQQAEWDDNGLRYCKYCNAYRYWEDLEDGMGWEGNLVFECRIVKCLTCGQDTYWAWENAYLE